MHSDSSTRPPVGDPVRDPARALALHRLATATGDGTAVVVPLNRDPAAAAPTPASVAPGPPWADPDGVRPPWGATDAGDVNTRAAERAAEAWADPPWWRRVRWAPDRVAGVALVVLVVALGAFSVHRLVAAVPDAGAPVPELPMEASGVPADPAAGEGEPGTVGASGGGASGQPPGGGPGPGAAAEPIVVSVVGMVQRSGLVSLPSGARVADALDAAGGVREGGDRDGLNLARRVADGEQILVGLAPGPDGPRGPRSGIVGAEPPAAAGAAAPSAGVGGAPGSSPGGAAPVNLNTADAAGLDALPGVGPVTAAAILAWRDAHGAFSSVDQLAEVDGIGPATLAKLRPLVTV